MGIENRVGAIGNNSLENCCIWQVRTLVELLTSVSIMLSAILIYELAVAVGAPVTTK